MARKPRPVLTPIQIAVAAAGGKMKLAVASGAPANAVTRWLRGGKVQSEYVLGIEAATGVRRHELRPDIYPPQEYEALESLDVAEAAPPVLIEEPAHVG